MSVETVRKKRLPGPARRAEILDVAVKLFRDNGYAATSLREIAEAADIQKASLYYYFRSKEDILVAINRRWMDHLFERAAYRRAQGGTPCDFIRGHILDCLEMMRDYRAHVEVFLRERHALSDEAWAPIARRRHEYEGYLREAVERGIEEGALRSDVDPAVVVYGIFGMTNWTHQWFSPDGRLTAPAIAEQFAAMVLDGLRARPDDS